MIAESRIMRMVISDVAGETDGDGRLNNYVERVACGSEGITNETAHLEKQHPEEEEARVPSAPECAPCESQQSRIEGKTDPEASHRRT
jgi:hypothetical protein